MSTKTDYRFVGAHVDNLDDGSVLEPLQKVPLTPEQAGGKHATRMISEGLLLEIEKPAVRTAATSSSKEGA
jgi:hypothetical protein